MRTDIHPSSRGLRRPILSTEALILATSVFCAAALNGPFWGAALAGRDPLAPATWLFAAGTFVAIVAAHFAVLALVSTRRTVRPLLSVLLAIGAPVAYYMQRYGVVVDAAMVRSVLRTDSREAGELLSPAALAALCASAMPIVLLWWVRVRPDSPWPRGAAFRLGCAVFALLAGAGAVAAVYKDLASLVRNHGEVRYMITPANVAFALVRQVARDARASHTSRAPPEPAIRVAAAGRRPTLLVLVVGETVRAANFGLSGYRRDTTPELAALDVITFPRASACGTSTEVSLPCMFSPFGRAGYDEARIRSHDSLLQVLARAGLSVVWRDNQSGCKGVCDGVEVEDLHAMNVPGICEGGRCLDEILLHDLDRIVRNREGDLVIVLHQLGNHGPAYYRRYPPEYARFRPACDRAELRDCTREEIVNAYDNAVAYTDHFLARVIGFLEGRRERFDVAMGYVSDHGESLGEYGLYLHGMPRAVAPREQVEVPMVWWMPADSARGFGVDVGCLRRRAHEPASHDNLYHSVLGLLEISTPSYRHERDLFAGCRSGLSVAAAPTGP